MRNKQPSILLCLTFLLIGFLFAALMFYVGLAGTEKARKEYRETKSMEKIQEFALNNKAGITPIPEKKGNWLGRFFTDYEPFYIVWIFILLLIGFYLIKLSFTSLPKNNPLNMSDLTRRCLILMCASFFLSPGLLFLYIWAIKVGLTQ